MRVSRVVLAILALVLLVAFLFPDRFPIPVVSQLADALRPQTEEKCPDLSAALPGEWTVVSTEALETDGDADNECLLVFRYDAGPDGVGPLGGVLYDLQPERAPADLETPVPYRPAAYIPYQLLPRPGGRGYLGESKIETAVYDADGDGRNELVVMGYAGYDFPVTLAIFQWVDKTQGYRSLVGPYYAHPETPVIFADAGFTIQHEATTQQGGTNSQGKIERVLARRRIYDPPHYARSQLARQTEYVWGAGGILVPLPDESIVFAFGRPSLAENEGQLEYAVMYPEAAVLAHYRDGDVLELYAPQEDPRLPQAPVVVRVKVKRADAQVIDTWSVIRQTTGKVREAVTWRLEKR